MAVLTPIWLILGFRNLTRYISRRIPRNRRIQTSVHLKYEESVKSIVIRNLSELYGFTRIVLQYSYIIHFKKIAINAIRIITLNMCFFLDSAPVGCFNSWGYLSVFKEEISVFGFTVGGSFIEELISFRNDS